MSYQLIERPHKQVFSGNPVRYVFQVSNPNTPGCAMEVALYVWDISADPLGTDGTLVTQQTLVPNPDGKVYFYCEDYLNSQLDWQLPSLDNNDVVAVTKQIKRFSVQYRQITKANQSPAWANDVTHHRLVLKGGIAKEKFDRNNFFINYLPTKLPFLTWLPDKHFIGLEERRYLTYFHFYDDPMVHITPQLKARVVYMDGTQEEVTKDFPDLSVSRLFHCPAGLKQLGLDNLHPDKQIWYYDVSIEDAGGGFLVINPYRMYADYRKYYNVFSFTYHNSLGGMDTLRIRGDWDIEVNLNSTDIQQATGGDFSGEILPTENTTINISGYKTFDGDAGWLNTQQMQEALEDLLLSDGIYRELFGTRWLRVMNLQKNQKMGNTADTKWSFPIKWRYTFDNNYFTPFANDFGAGVMDEPAGPVWGTCTAPSGLTVALTDDGVATKTFRLSWDAVGDALSYDVDVTHPDGSVVTTAGILNTYLDVTLADVGDYSWRVRSKCGVNDYSGYSIGAGFTVFFAAVLCAAPANLNAVLMAINGSNADIKFAWDPVPGVYGYWVEWREAGSSAAWQSGFQLVTNRTVTLAKDVQYEWRVRSQCDNSGVLHCSGYVYGATFIPSNMVGSCAAPNGPMATSVPMLLNYIVKFDWVSSPTADNYDLQFRKVGTTSWITRSGVMPGVLASLPLAPGTEYEWRVRANCTGGGQSNFINGANFIL